MKYTNIKNILKRQISNGTKPLWTFDEENKEFMCIYKNYSDNKRIYTARQLLNKLSEKGRGVCEK